MLLRFMFIFAIGVSAVPSRATVLTDFSGGIEFAGAPTILLSDSSVGAFGFGAGYNLGAFAISQRSADWGLKLRLDRYFSRQESLNRAEVPSVASGSFLKALTQQYTILSVGAEWRSKSSNDIFFSEALLGYAIGVHGKIEMVNQDGAAQGGELSSRDIPLMSRFAVMAGLGYRRAFRDRWTLQAGVRTFFLLGAPYDKELQDKAYIPIPFLLSIGLIY